MSKLSEGVQLSQAAKVRSQLRQPAAAPASVSPWEREAPADKSSKTYQPQTLDTCPWGPSDDAQSVKSGRYKAAQHNTCPWGDGGRGDRDSVALQRAERLKQRAPPSQVGCAGVGAPRVPAPERVPESQQMQADFHQEIQKDSSSSSAPVPELNSSTFSSAYDPEAEAQERSMLIEKCLQHGLNDEEIEEMLREHMFQKEMERQQREVEAEKSETLKPGLAPVNTSIAAQRQAKAKGNGKGSPQYGPSNEEIADMLYNNRTPSPQVATVSGVPQVPTPTSIRDRKKVEVTGKVTGGDLGSTGSRNAFFECKQGASAAKDRNRLGQGIF